MQRKPEAGLKMVMLLALLFLAFLFLFRHGAFFLFPFFVLIPFWLWRHRGDGQGAPPWGGPEDPADWWKKPKDAA